MCVILPQGSEQCQIKLAKNFQLSVTENVVDLLNINVMPLELKLLR